MTGTASHKSVLGTPTATHCSFLCAIQWGFAKNKELIENNMTVSFDEIQGLYYVFHATVFRLLFVSVCLVVIASQLINSLWGGSVYVELFPFLL